MCGKGFVGKLHFIVSILCAFSLVLGICSVSSADGYKFNMSYIYFGEPDSHISLVDNAGRLDEVSPNYFDIASDGNLKITSDLSTEFINDMQQRGIRVVPFLSNHWDRDAGIKALERRHILADQIVQAIRKYGLDGVHIDIENVTEKERDNYTDFIRLLRERLPKGSILAVAVAANPRNFVTGWQGSYDYKALAEYCDYLMVMAYDEHYAGGSAGPVASIQFVEASIEYALKRVKPEKIVLGIPFFGRYWKVGETRGGYGISLEDVSAMIEKYGAEINYDSYQQSPEAVLSIKNWQSSYYIYGTELKTGTYHIWYENEESIKKKLDLVREYNLKGTGSWSLGQETIQTWNYFDMWLNGYYYEDVQGHWAQDEMIYAAQKKLMNGYSNTWFGANRSLTRAETAAIFVRALGLEIKESANAFDDVDGHWAKNEINTAAAHGIIIGMGNGLFEPERAVTRQEIAVIMDRIKNGAKPVITQQEEGVGAEEDEASIESPFSDVTPARNTWAYEAIIRMSEEGLLCGYKDGFFRPLNNITRAEMAVILSRMY